MPTPLTMTVGWHKGCDSMSAAPCRRLRIGCSVPTAQCRLLSADCSVPAVTGRPDLPGVIDLVTGVRVDEVPLHARVRREPAHPRVPRGRAIVPAEAVD